MIPTVYSHVLRACSIRWAYRSDIPSPLLGRPCLTVMRFHRQASQSCPSLRTRLPWAVLVGGTSGNALSQASQEGVGGLFPQVPNIHSTIQGLG